MFKLALKKTSVIKTDEEKKEQDKAEEPFRRERRKYILKDKKVESELEKVFAQLRRDDHKVV